MTNLKKPQSKKPMSYKDYLKQAAKKGDKLAKEKLQEYRNS